MRKLCCRLIVSFLAVAIVTVHCVDQALALSISEERKIGEKLLYSVRATFPLLDDPDLHQYINELGDEVLGVAGLQYFKYRFYLINDDEFNAFAAPSGMIFFYSGLINKMRQEDELVSVLAHEIGHVAKRHIAGRAEKGKVIGAASLAVALAALALGGGAATQALLTGSMAAGQSATLHFSRKDEEEADLLAYDWMTKMLRNPISQKRMLQTMRRISRYRSDRLPQYLLTHPNPEARLDYVESLINIDKLTEESFPKGDQFRFHRFRYRIMADSMDSLSFREYISSILADDRSSDFDQTMARYGMAQLERKVNHYEKSEEMLEQVISTFPDKSILLVDRAVLYFDAGRFVDARKNLEQALFMDQTDMYGAFYLGKTYHALGEVQKAIDQYRAVSYKMPEYSKVYFELGKIASQMKDNDTASLNLGKYYLYEGKLKLSRFSLDNVLKSKTAEESHKNEAKRMLEIIERIKKD